MYIVAFEQKVRVKKEEAFIDTVICNVTTCAVVQGRNWDAGCQQMAPPVQHCSTHVPLRRQGHWELYTGRGQLPPYYCEASTSYGSRPSPRNIGNMLLDKQWRKLYIRIK